MRLRSIHGVGSGLPYPKTSPLCTLPETDSIPRVAGTAAADDSPGDDIQALCQHLLGLAPVGLARSYLPGSRSFAHTARQRKGRAAPGIELMGASLRYAAISALGLALLSHDDQRQVLAGETTTDLVRQLSAQAADTTDPGAAALALWAIAEVSGAVDESLLNRVIQQVDGMRPIPTVDAAWTLTALLASGPAVPPSVVHGAARRILEAQHDNGLFPHLLPEARSPMLRRHVGCFADQVYPIQALSRYHRVFGDQGALAAANSCGNRIADLQGPSGQWWWHYDVRLGTVLEGYPVYSVHQHAMAPMALFELREAGGSDRRSEVFKGLRWITERPETDANLIADDAGLVWRSVRRREPFRG